MTMALQRQSASQHISGVLECSPGLTLAADRAARVSVITGYGCWELFGSGRRLLALDEAAAHRAYRYLLNLDTASTCRAVADDPCLLAATGNSAAGGAI